MARIAKRTTVLTVRLTRSERESLVRLARLASMRVSDLIRRWLRNAAQAENLTRI